MQSIAAVKSWLSLLFLMVMAGAAFAAPPVAGSVYRFGEWMLVTPVPVEASALAAGPYTLALPAEGSEWRLYHGDGQQRALALRFAADPAKDVAILHTHDFTGRLKGCHINFDIAARMPRLKAVQPADAVVQELPDDTVIAFAGTDRGLRRVGEELIADLGPYRVKISADSPIVRLGEWDSADFCRFELHERED